MTAQQMEREICIDIALGWASALGLTIGGTLLLGHPLASAFAFAVGGTIAMVARTRQMVIIRPNWKGP